MSHKDWDGPGVYNCFEGKKWIGTKPKDQSDHLCGSFDYEKLENFEPPKPLREELPDGLYLLVGKNSGSLYLAIKCGDVFRDETNNIVDLEKYTVTNRIPTEPI